MSQLAAVPVYLRQMMADGNTRVMEFRARELSLHHVFVAAGDLSLLDVGEQVEVLIGVPGERFSAGRARVVGSERVFGPGPNLSAGEFRLPASGYRLAFAAPGPSFRAVLERLLCTDAGAGAEGALPETGLEPARS